MEPLLGVHMHDYKAKVAFTVKKLNDIWEDLELEDSDRQDEIQKAMGEAAKTWDAALDRAAQLRLDAQSQIEGMQREVSGARDQLGEYAESFAYQNLAEGTLMKQYRATKEQLALWRDRKAQRMQEIEALQATISRLHMRMGRNTHARSFQDLTSSELERLSIEIQCLQDECQKRQQTLESALLRLRSQCDELGEDARLLATEAHPSLQSLGEPNACGEEVDLSDRTLKLLDQKMEKLRQVKAERRQQAAIILSTLEGLWDLLDMADDDMDRKKFQTMLNGPSCVHATVLDNAKGEVECLEERKAELIRKMIELKRRELEELCAESHMPVPPLPGVDAPVEVRGQAAISAQVAEVLAKVIKQVSNAEAEGQRRNAILEAIDELQVMRAECSWLAKYDQDDSRYKGRDANRKLQRAIKAGKIRDRMPAVFEQMQGMLEAWLETQSKPFIYDGRDYKEMLAEVSAEVEAEAQQRAAAHQQKTQGTRMAAAAAGTPARRPNMVMGRGIAPSTPRTPAADRAASPGVSPALCAGSQAQQRRTPKLHTPRGEALPACDKDASVPAKKKGQAGSASRLSLAAEEKMSKLLTSCTMPLTALKAQPFNAATNAQPLTVMIEESSHAAALSSPSRMASPFSVAAAADKWKQSPKPKVPKLPVETLQRMRSF